MGWDFLWGQDRDGEFYMGMGGDGNNLMATEWRWEQFYLLYHSLVPNHWHGRVEVHHSGVANIILFQTFNFTEYVVIS